MICVSHCICLSVTLHSCWLESVHAGGRLGNIQKVTLHSCWLESVHAGGRLGNIQKEKCQQLNGCFSLLCLLIITVSCQEKHNPAFEGRMCFSEVKTTSLRSLIQANSWHRRPSRKCFHPKELCLFDIVVP